MILKATTVTRIQETFHFFLIIHKTIRVAAKGNIEGTIWFNVLTKETADFPVPILIGELTTT